MKPDAYTILYGVIGNPVRHSKGPLIHNACFRHYEHNAVYLAFEIKYSVSAVNTIRTLDIKGASITIPHKTSIMDYLDHLHPDARQIGAVNTIVNTDGRLTGYNTDCQAAVRPLIPFGIAGKTVGIVGSGGAARAVAVGLKNENASITIISRNDETGQDLASRVNGSFVNILDDAVLSGLDAEVLINATPVGMFPDVADTPYPARYLNPGMVVMDIIYNPVQTLLLKQARAIGCRTVDGLSMFLVQAAAQFELWTGINPELNIMKEALANDSNER
jgi:shikimate dehydrogenase